MPTRDDTALTIDELAQRLGMTVRNLREWRTLGLLPPAEMHGRVGYYPADVVARLERAKRLHSEGFTLELIARMLETGGDDVMRLAATLRAPVDAEAPAQRLARMRVALDELGLPEEEVLKTLARIQEHAEQVAAIFERLWLDTFWEPFVAAGMPDDGLERIQETAEQVKPLALEAMSAVFAAAMDAQIERGIARELAARRDAVS